VREIKTGRVYNHWEGKAKLRIRSGKGQGQRRTIEHKERKLTGGSAAGKQTITQRGGRRYIKEKVVGEGKGNGPLSNS